LFLEEQAILLAHFS